VKIDLDLNFLVNWESPQAPALDNTYHAFKLFIQKHITFID